MLCPALFKNQMFSGIEGTVCVCAVVSEKKILILLLWFLEIYIVLCFTILHFKFLQFRDFFFFLIFKLW